MKGQFQFNKQSRAINLFQKEVILDIENKIHQLTNQINIKNQKLDKLQKKWTAAIKDQTKKQKQHMILQINRMFQTLQTTISKKIASRIQTSKEMLKITEQKWKTRATSIVNQLRNESNQNNLKKKQELSAILNGNFQKQFHFYFKTISQFKLPQINYFFKNDAFTNALELIKQLQIIQSSENANYLDLSEQNLESQKYVQGQSVVNKEIIGEKKQEKQTMSKLKEQIINKKGKLNQQGKFDPFKSIQYFKSQAQVFRGKRKSHYAQGKSNFEEDFKKLLTLTEKKKMLLKNLQ